MATKTTPTPTGTAISRSGTIFTCSWKAAAKNHDGGQGFKWRTTLEDGKSKSAYTTVSISASARSKDITLSTTDTYVKATDVTSENFASKRGSLFTKEGSTYTAVGGSATYSSSTTYYYKNESDYYPSPNKPIIKGFGFVVRGKQAKKGKKTPAKKMSAWTDEKVFKLSPPNEPSSECVLTYSDVDNSSTMSWSTEIEDTGEKWFTNVLLQTAFVEDMNAHGKDIDPSLWEDVGAYAGSYSVTREEDTNVIYQPNNKSYTRWFRVKARGPAGDSSYSYGYHVYAKPYKSIIEEANAIENIAANNTIQVYAKWNTNVEKYSRPHESTTVQYCLASPYTGFTLPDGASWSDGPTIVDTSGLSGSSDNTGRNSNASTFIIDGPLQEDQCLFLRVNSKHDSKITQGDSQIVTGLNYRLSTPTITAISPNPQTNIISISASNPSAQNIPDSKLAVIFRASNAEDKVLGILTGANPSSQTIRCPDWSQYDDYAIGIYAFADARTIGYTEHTEGGRTYRVYDVPSDVLMKSEEEWDSGDVPKAPKASDIALSSPMPDTIQVAWDWPWDSANISELSWSDHSDAWESTDEPSTYRISNVHAAKWNIKGLESGVEWYIRVRLIKSFEDSEIEGPWSPIVSYKLTSAPDVPNLRLSKYVISNGESFTASWDYISTDGTSQNMIQICPVTIDSTTGEITYGDNILDIETTDKEYTFDPSILEWSTGNSYYLCARVKSESERLSGWSEPVRLDIADPLTADISSSSLETRTIDGVTRYYLTEMPFTITISGAGDNAYTNLVIERENDYHASKPDESSYDGFKGETVAYFTQQGDAEITINVNDLTGALDDTAEYRIIATVYDDLGQSAVVERTFIVEWEHQAIVPEATVEIDNENYIAKITPVIPDELPVGWILDEGDVCDIYRISADKPELIIKNGHFGTTYVDPYPAIGEYGGHRVVFKTVNGDYITTDGTYAWIDLNSEDGDIFNLDASLIDFPNGQIDFMYNIDLSSSWHKDFQETKYLGGSVQGDWNPGVSRTGTISTVSVLADDKETIQDFRKLADYPGICHIRTRDGSSFAADIQVSEDMKYESYQVVSYNLSITRVNAQSLDGLTLAEWEEMQEE